jgi:MFS family permease
MATDAIRAGEVSPRLTSNRLVLVLLMLCYAVNFADRTIINTLGEAIKRDLHLSDTQLGLLGGLSFALLYAVMSIPVARYSDRHSRVKILSVAITFWSAATMICATAVNYASLLAMRVAVGVGESGCSPPAQSLITDYFPRAKRAFAISIYYIGVPLGTFGGAMFAGTLAERYGWRTAYLVVGAPGLLLALALLIFLKEPPRGRFDPGEASDDTPSFGTVVRTLWYTPGLRNVAAGTTLGAFTLYSIGQFLHPLFVRDFGLPYGQAALAFGFISAISAAIGTPIGGALADRLSQRDARWIAWLPGLGLLLAVPLHVFSVLQSSWTVLAACLFVAGIVANFYHGPTYASIHNRISPRMRATTTAILMFLSSAIGLGFGPLLTGMASDWYAANAYAGAGGYRTLCMNHDALAGAGAAAAEACRAASGTGVRYALATVAFVNILAAGQYFLAASRLDRGRGDVAPETGTAGTVLE